MPAVATYGNGLSSPSSVRPMIPRDVPVARRMMRDQGLSMSQAATALGIARQDLDLAIWRAIGNAAT